MFWLRLRLRPLTWLALAAILALALLPAVSHALTFARGNSHWVEVCTPQGMKLVALSGDSDSDSSSHAPVQAAGHLEHCPLCALQALDLAPPPAVQAPLLLPVASAHVPRLYLQAPRTLFAWRSAQPRGPPTVS